MTVGPICFCWIAGRRHACLGGSIQSHKNKDSLYGRKSLESGRIEQIVYKYRAPPTVRSIDFIIPMHHSKRSISQVDSFVIISEISSTRLRGRTIAITTAVQAMASIVFTVAMPYMLNSDQANWRGKAEFLFGGISTACFVWCWFRILELRGRTFEELDILFERKVPARMFREYDLLAGQHEGSGTESPINV
jgi:hypothetical protein